MQVNLDYEASKKNQICDFCYDNLFKTVVPKTPSLPQTEKSSIEHLILKR
jgi:hypothetical protein